MITFEDPVHGEIAILDRFGSILGSRTLARLRNIKQLGYSVARYPGAVHTRFEHTLGTAAVLSEVLSALGVPLGSPRAIESALAALVSEVGSTPLSYTTRPVFQAVGLTKVSIRQRLLSYELAGEPGVADLLVSLDSGRRMSVPEWDAVCGDLPAFGYLDPVKLASMIDYVQRDAHYCGRQHDAFDYKGFLDALRDYVGGHRPLELHEQLQGLHRAAFSLNTVYGDSDRRALTTLLRRVAAGLIESGSLDLAAYGEPSRLIDLDDDVFMSDLSSAMSAATDRDEWLDAFNQVIEMREFATYLLSDLGIGHEGVAVEIVEAEVGRKLGLDPRNVVVFGGSFDDHNGFRMFGTDYATAQDAITSDPFSALTGLSVAAISPSVPGPARASTVRPE